MKGFKAKGFKPQGFVLGGPTSQAEISSSSRAPQKESVKKPPLKKVKTTKEAAVEMPTPKEVVPPTKDLVLVEDGSGDEGGDDYIPPVIVRPALPDGTLVRSTDSGIGNLAVAQAMLTASFLPADRHSMMSETLVHGLEGFMESYYHNLVHATHAYRELNEYSGHVEVADARLKSLEADLQRQKLHAVEAEKILLMLRKGRRMLLHGLLHLKLGCCP